jgi:hypothetical protein
VKPSLDAPSRSDNRAITVKSNKQRRAELQAEKRARALRKQASNTDALASRGIRVDIEKLAPDNSYGNPDFVERGFYEDHHFTCQHCGKKEIWTARQQKWWYEIAKGNVWTTARLCRPCRRRERERRNEARRIHTEGLAKKRGGEAVA